MHSVLLEDFGVDGENFVLLFHEPNESCAVQRPLSDLFNFIQNRFDRKTLYMHPIFNRAGAINPLTGRIASPTTVGNAPTSDQSERTIEQEQPPSKQTKNPESGPSMSQSQGNGKASPASNVSVNGSTMALDSMDKGYIKTRIQFESPSRSLMLDPKMWESVDDHLPQDTNLRDVFGSMRDDAVTQLRKDSKILNLKDNISFWPLVKIPEDVSRYASIDEYGKCRVLLLRDLFKEISKDTRLSLVATLQKAEGKSRATIRVPHKTKKGAFERAPDAERMLRNDWEDEYVYYRVGTKTLNDDDLSSSEQRVPQQHTIVAWYQKNEVEDEHRLQFSVVPSWNANDIELGNNDLGKLESNIPEGTIIDRRYGASASKSSIHKLLASKEDQDQTIIAALKRQVPQLPLHCFNPNDEMPWV